MILFLILVLCSLGDLLLNHRFQIGDCIEKGLQSCGSLLLCMGGWYAILIPFIHTNIESITKILSILPFDSSIIVGSILAPDMGATPIIQTLTLHHSLIAYSGVLLTSTLGCFISFQLPIFTSQVSKGVYPVLMKGFVKGIIALGIVMLPIAWILQILNPFLNTLPIAVVTILLALSLRFAANQTIKVLSIFANIIRMISYGLFFFLAISFFIELPFVSKDAAMEICYVVLKMSIVITGSLVLCKLIQRFATKALSNFAQRLGMNEASLMGLFLHVLLLLLCSLYLIIWMRKVNNVMQRSLFQEHIVI